MHNFCTERAIVHIYNHTEREVITLRPLIAFVCVCVCVCVCFMVGGGGGRGGLKTKNQIKTWEEEDTRTIIKLCAVAANDITHSVTSIHAYLQGQIIIYMPVECLLCNEGDPSVYIQFRKQ